MNALPRWARSLTVFVCTLVAGASVASANWDEGVAAFRQENYRRAIDRLESTLRADPKDARAHYLLGLALAHEGRKREALEQFRIALDPALFGLDPAMFVHLREDERIVRRTKAAELAERADELGDEFRESLDRPAIERPARPR